jgi:hypothetical protein
MIFIITKRKEERNVFAIIPILYFINSFVTLAETMLKHRIIAVGIIKKGSQYLIGRKPTDKGPYPNT